MPKRAYKLSENGSVAIPCGIASYMLTWLEKSGLKSGRIPLGKSQLRRDPQLLPLRAISPQPDTWSGTIRASHL
jgi:hypothetical protein